MLLCSCVLLEWLSQSESSLIAVIAEYRCVGTLGSCADKDGRLNQRRGAYATGRQQAVVVDVVEHDL